MIDSAHESIDRTIHLTISISLTDIFEHCVMRIAGMLYPLRHFFTGEEAAARFFSMRRMERLPIISPVVIRQISGVILCRPGQCRLLLQRRHSRLSAQLVKIGQPPVRTPYRRRPCEQQ